MTFLHIRNSQLRTVCVIRKLRQGGAALELLLQVAQILEEILVPLPPGDRACDLPLRRGPAEVGPVAPKQAPTGHRVPPVGGPVEQVEGDMLEARLQVHQLRPIAYYTTVHRIPTLVAAFCHPQRCGKGNSGGRRGGADALRNEIDLFATTRPRAWI